MKPYVLSILVAGMTVSCGHKSQTAALPDLPKVVVEMRTVQSHAISVYEEIVGTVVPRLAADVTAKVTGRVLELSAVPGMRVKSGDVLARLEVGELNAAFERAEATLAQANRDLERYRGLRAANAATPAELERAESQQRIAAATMEETRSLVANATVTAPFDGTVTRKYLEPGDLASPARALFSMEDASLLRLSIDVAQSLAGQIALGDTLRIEVAGADIEGTVSEIAPSADVGSRTFSIKLDLPGNDVLRAGQFGRAFLPRGERTALLVPASAIVTRGQMDYLFVASEGVARLRIVRTGGTRDGQTEILSGLDDGETVVTEPPSELRDGQPLESK